MKKYAITIKTLSDTMLGSGESLPGIIDNDIRYDQYGLPYMFAKTLKGHIREQMEMLQTYSSDPVYTTTDVNTLLGAPADDGDKRSGLLKFTDVQLPEDLRAQIAHDISRKLVTANEVLDALTITYTSTSIDSETGTSKKHTLRTERLVKKGLKFYSTLYLDDQGLSPEKLKTYNCLITDAFAALQHIGTHKSKGKGYVECSVKEVQK